MAARSAAQAPRKEHISVPVRRNYANHQNWGARDAAIARIQRNSICLAHSLNHLFQEGLYIFNASAPASPPDTRPINLAAYCSTLRPPEPACDNTKKPISDAMIDRIIRDRGYRIGDAAPETYNSRECIGLLIKIDDPVKGMRWACMAKQHEICSAGFSWSLLDTLWRDQAVCSTSFGDLWTYFRALDSANIVDIKSVIYTRGAQISRAAVRLGLVAGPTAPPLYSNVGDRNNLSETYGENHENDTGGGGVSEAQAAAAAAYLRKKEVQRWVTEYLEDSKRAGEVQLAEKREEIRRMQASIEEHSRAMGQRGKTTAELTAIDRIIRRLEDGKTRLESDYEASSTRLQAEYEAEKTRMILAQQAHNAAAIAARRPLPTGLLDVPARARAPQPVLRLAAAPSAVRRGGFTRRKHQSNSQTRRRNRFHH